MRVQGRYDSGFQLFKEISCENRRWRNLRGKKQGSTGQTCNHRMRGYFVLKFKNRT